MIPPGSSHACSEPPEVDKPVDPATYREEYEELVEKDGKPFWPDAAWRDVVFGSLVVLTVLALALLIGAPEVVTPPDPSDLNVNPRPDWYLMWYFAVLSLSPAQIEDYIIVGAPVLGLGLLFVFPLFFGKGHRHPKKRPWSVLIVATIVIGLAAMTVIGEQSPWSPDFDAKPLRASVTQGLTPDQMQGALLFHEKGCEYCHEIDGQGGHRGPNLSHIGDLLSPNELTIRVMNGAHNMPSFAGNITGEQLHHLVEFLETRKAPPPARLPQHAQ